MEKKRIQQNFMQGAFIMTTATIIVKLIGAIFKIPFGNLLGGTGMGYFTTAYDLYMPFYSLAMAGLPIAISRLVAERVVEKRFSDVKKTLKMAQRIFLVTGITGTVILLLIAYPFVIYTKNLNALYSILTVMPALLFCCIMSSYRGFYEGLRNMYPTAISSIIEALGKLFLGLGFAYIVVLKAKAEYAGLGTVFGQAIDKIDNAEQLNSAIVMAASPYAAAAGILGITIGSAIGAVFLIVYHKVVGPKITREEMAASPLAHDNKQTLRMILTISIPVVLGSLVTNFSGLIDLITVQRRLVDAVQQSPNTFLTMYGGVLPEGINSGSSLEKLVTEVPNYLYGCYKGFGYSIFNLVPSITSVLGISALPVLATAWIEQKKDVIKSNIESMIKMISLIAIPAGVGITVLAGQLLSLLYENNSKEIVVTTPILTILGVAAVFTGLTAPLTNMLQAIGKQNIPVRNIAIGAVLKFIVNIVLVGIPAINVLGAPIGTLVCYVFHFSASFYCLVKYAKVRLNYWNIILKPLLASLLCGVTAYFSNDLLSNMITNSRIVTVLSIGAAAVVYVAAVVVTKCITKEDLQSIKMGAK